MTLSQKAAQSKRIYEFSLNFSYSIDGIKADESKLKLGKDFQNKY